LGSGRVHKSLGRFEFMISIWRNTGDVCDHGVKRTRAFGIALPAIPAVSGLANGGACNLDPKPDAFSDDLQASGRS